VSDVETFSLLQVSVVHCTEIAIIHSIRLVAFYLRYVRLAKKRNVFSIQAPQYFIEAYANNVYPRTRQYLELIMCEFNLENTVEESSRLNTDDTCP
jgi:hypothetical protein